MRSLTISRREEALLIIPSVQSQAAILLPAVQKATLEKAAKGDIERPSERRAAQMQQVRMLLATYHIIQRRQQRACRHDKKCRVSVIHQ